MLLFTTICYLTTKVVLRNRWSSISIVGRDMNLTTWIISIGGSGQQATCHNPRVKSMA